MKCLNCSKFTKNPKFCSRSCAASINNKLSPKRILSKNCKNCDLKIASNKIYCSAECRRSHKGFSIVPQKENKESQRTRSSRYRRELKQKALDYLGGKCSLCGYNKCVQALDFHHLDPLQKDFTISSKKTKFDKLKSELDKCILVCANCHREIHENSR